MIKNNLQKWVLFLVLVVGVLFTYQFAKPKGSLPQNLWGAKLVDKYKDEPRVENEQFKVSSSSAWIIPSDPYTVRQGFDDIDFVIEDLSADKWNKWPSFKSKLDEQNLEKRYYDYFVKAGFLPTLAEDFDTNGDSIKDRIFQSIGVGCASCHFNQIEIFVGDKRYQSSTNDGRIYPRADGKGFYIISAYTGNEESTCCPDNFLVGKYEWNGNGYTEIARKVVYVTRK